MEIYIAVLEEDARVARRDVDLSAFDDRDEGMRNKYEQACCQSLAYAQAQTHTLAAVYADAEPS